MFKILLTLSLLLTAGTSAYMAVFGLMQVFSQYSMAIGCMGAGMELGKILVIIYLHRGWKTLRATHKFYYAGVIFCLVFLTSVEIFGFLAQSHSKTGEETALIASRLGFLHSERDLLREELETLEKTLSALPEGYVTKRFAFRKENNYGEKRQRLLQINNEIDQLEGSRIRSMLNAGPVFAVSRIFNIRDTASIIMFILLLVGVVEPLSVGLTVAVSAQWASKSKEKMSPEHRERIRKRLSEEKQQIPTIDVEAAERKFKRSK